MLVEVLIECRVVAVAMAEAAPAVAGPAVAVVVPRLLSQASRISEPEAGAHATDSAP